LVYDFGPAAFAALDLFSGKGESFIMTLQDISLTGAAKIAGVMGWPVAHSRSPRLHGYWLKKYGIDGAYVPFPVKPSDLEKSLRALPALGIRGVNLTVPHKENALLFMDHIEATARRIGAVNTVVVQDDGSLLGRNTDAYGFLENLKAHPAFEAGKGPAVVIGAGGAARAVIAALQDAGVPEIRILNRTRARADALCQDFGIPCRSQDWDLRADSLADAALLIQTTTQGMAGHDALDLDLAKLPTSALVNDIVYTPLQTPLLAAAAARGNPVQDGLGMLLHQARAGFQAWFGVDPVVDAGLRHAVLGPAVSGPILSGPILSGLPA
jgi:shikimate dehydrogenase